MNPITECLYRVYDVDSLAAAPTVVLWAWDQVARLYGGRVADLALTDLNSTRERHGKTIVVVPYGYVPGVV